MQFNFLQKKITAFGLDVGGSTMKILELGGSPSQRKILGYSEATVPKAMIINDAIADTKTFTYLLKQSLEKPVFGRINSKYAVVSLPEAKSFVRVIQIPKMGESEAASAIPYEAENFIPLPLDQVYLDWKKISETVDKMNILIIASPKDFVDTYLDVLDQSGIKIAALEVESQSCHRALVGATSRDSQLILDLDAFRSSLIMVEDGALQFTSSIPIAGNTFTESIARSLGVSSAKAEEIKCAVGINNTNEYPNIKTALLPVLNNLSNEVKNILKFHDEHSEKKVLKIILSGGSARLTNLAEFLAPQIAEFAPIPVELGNPWQNVAGIVKPPMDSQKSLSYITAIGLALRGVNL